MEAAAPQQYSKAELESFFGSEAVAGKAMEGLRQSPPRQSVKEAAAVESQ